MTAWLRSSKGVAARLILEKLIADTVALDPVTAKRLAELDGTTVQLCLTAPSLSLFIHFGAHGIDVRAHSEAAATVTIKGPWHRFLLLLQPHGGMAQLHRSGIELAGDLTALQRLAAILKSAQFDWEALLARHTGGIFAGLAGTFSRHTHARSRHLLREFSLNLTEFLQEEARLLPARAEYDIFNEQTDQLRLQTDRLAARLAGLEGLCDGKDA